MKKTILIILAFFMCFSLCACNTENTEYGFQNKSETKEELRSRVYGYREYIADIRRDSILEFIKMARQEEAEYTFEEATEMLEYHYPLVMNICEIFMNEDWAEAPDVLKAKHIKEDLEAFYNKIKNGTITESNISAFLDELKELDLELEHFWFSISEYWDKLA